MYELKDEYLTGIPAIDAEHRVLFEIADEIYQLSVNEFVPDKYDNIAHLIQRLNMESIQYKQMFTQKVQHNHFKEKLEEMDLDAIDEDQDGAIQDLLKFVTDWLVEHILETDKKIAE